MPVLPQPSALNPLKDAAKDEAIDYTTDFESLFTWLDSIEKFIHTLNQKNSKTSASGSIWRNLNKKKAYVNDTYKGHRVAGFNIELTNNQYINFHNVHLIFPMKIKKGTNKASNLDSTVMTVNNFFAHWIKEIDIKWYSDEIPILLLINRVDIYRYSDPMLKFEEDDALKTYQHYF